MKLDKNLKNQMRGLLPFDSDSIDSFTPKEYKKLPIEFQPIFHLKPWIQKEKDKALLISEKLQASNTNSEKIKINNEINCLTRKNIINIENLYDIGNEEFIVVEKDTDFDCVSLDVWDKIPKPIQTSVYFCLSSISGLISSEIVGL